MKNIAMERRQSTSGMGDELVLRKVGCPED